MSVWDDISIYLKPSCVFNSSEDETSIHFLRNQTKIFSSTSIPDLEGVKIALLGVKEERGSIRNSGCAQGPDEVRKQLYSLFLENAGGLIADIGNVEPGETREDTYYAVTNILAILLRKGIVPVILGGSQDITFPAYAAYEKMESTINMVSVDAKFDIGEFREDTDSANYLGKIILHEPNYLFNYSNIGHQKYFVDPEMTSLMNKLFFDVYRLGEVKEHLPEMEPIIRNADLLTIDISSVKASDSPASALAGPNGFSGQEICQLCYYAGMSDKLSSIGIFEFNPSMDKNNQTAMLIAQMIWCFLDGFMHRKNDFPFTDKNNYLKYRIAINDVKEEIIFYKSLLSDRWWMDVPYPPDKMNRYERHHLVPCSYRDYLAANNNELPDKWWQTYQKLI